MPQRSHRWYWILLAFLAVLGLQHACQKDNPVKPDSGTSARIDALQADRVVIGPGESTRVRAWVVEGPEPGTPVSGVCVEFGTVGGLDPGIPFLESVSDADGVATTTFYAPQAAGSVTIWARVCGTTDKKYVTITVLVDSTTLDVSTPGGIRVPGDGSTGLMISIVATRILAQGAPPSPLAGLRIVLAAGDQFTDTNSNGVYDQGEPIPAEGDRNGNGRWDAEGSLPEFVATGVNGAASFTYKAGHAIGPVYLRMTGGGVSKEITLEQISPVLVVTLESETSTLLADGVSQATVTVSVRKPVNSPGVGWALSPAANTMLFCTAGESFTDTNGNGFHDPGEVFEAQNGNGRWDPMGSVPSSVTTDADGTATLLYTAGIDPGTATIRATTMTGEFGTLNIELVSVVPAGRLAVVLNPPPPVPFYADGLGVVNGCVTVMDANGDPLPGKPTPTVVAGEKFTDVDADGVFDAGDVLLDDADRNGVWTSAGTVTWIGTGITDAAGRACFTLTVGLVPMRVWIHAAVDGVIAETSFDLAPRPSVCSIELKPTFPTMTVLGGGGVTCNTLVATCWTCDYRLAPAGVNVSFCLMEGPGGGEHLGVGAASCVDALTDASGEARVPLYSGTRSGWVEVIATSGDAESPPMRVELLPGAVIVVSTPNGRIDLAADTAGRADRADTLTICATATTGVAGDLLAGVPLTWVAEEGSLLPSVATTDAQGRACVVYRAGPTVGPVYVRVTGGGISQEITLQQHEQALVVTLTSMPGVLLANGVEQATVTVTVKDWAQNPAPGELLFCTVSEPSTDTKTNGFRDPSKAFEDLKRNGSANPLGSVIPSQVTTGAAGIAVFTYTAGIQPGIVTVRATTTAGDFGAVNLKLASPLPASRLEVGFDPPPPDPLFADGNTIVRGSVGIFDLNDQPLAGKRVTIVAGEKFDDVNRDGVFTASTADRRVNDDDNNGAWTSAGTVTLDGDSLTGADGKIGFSFRVGTVPMRAWVHAAVDGKIAEAPLDLLALPGACSVTLGWTFPTMTILGGGGVTCNTVTATILTCEGQPAPAGTSVEFCLTEGPGGGERLGNAKSGCVIAVTDTLGVAEAKLYSGTKPGRVKVVATSGHASAFTEIEIKPSVTLLAVALDLPDPLYYANGRTVIHGVVTATDLSGAAALPKSVTVVVGERFDDLNADGVFTQGIDKLYDADGNRVWTSAGTVTVDGLTDADGKVNFEFTVGLVPMRAWVHAAVDGATADAQVDLLPLPDACEVRTTWAFPSMTVIGGNGVICNTLTASAFTSNDTPAPAGMRVEFRLTSKPGGGEYLKDAFHELVTKVTNDAGEAEAVFYSGTKSGRAIVEVKVVQCGAIDYPQIYIAPGAASTMICDADSLQLAPRSQCLVRAAVRDTAHNPVEDGTRIRFRADKGIVNPAEATTSNGVATAIFTTLLGDAGVARITAEGTGASGRPLSCSIDIQIRPDGGSVPPTAEFFTCAADSAWLVPGEPCAVRTRVTNAAHNPVPDGTLVTFSANMGVVAGSAGGGISYTQNGVAVALFTAPPTSVDTEARVLAITAGKFDPELNCTSRIPIRGGGPGEPTAVYLFCGADSSQLASGSACQVWAQALDVNHNPVPDVTAVRFTVDEGMVNPAVSYTVGGVAVATFTAPRTSSSDGVASVTASTEGVSGGLSCSRNIQIPGGSGTACRVTLVPDTTTIAVRGTGVTDQTFLRARVYDCRDLPVGTGVQVEFRIESGPGDGVSFAGCSDCVYNTVTTDETGTAKIILRAGIHPGTVLVQASVVSSVGVENHCTVTIAAGPPEFLSAGVGVGFENVLACGIVDVVNVVTALVYDLHHNPVRDGTAVWFSSNYGMVTASATTADGIVTGTWRSTGECGIDSVWVSTRGGEVADTVSFFSSAPADTVRFVDPNDHSQSAAPLVALPADGVSTLPLWVVVLDEHGGPVLPMTPELNLSPVDGSVEIGATGDGYHSSIARGTYTAPVLDLDRSVPAGGDDGIGSTVTVSASAGHGSHGGDHFHIVLLTDVALLAHSALNLGTSMPVGSVSPFTITVKDKWGNPLGGHRLTITATDGEILPVGVRVTDSHGMASGLTFTAPAAAGTVTVTVADQDAPTLGLEKLVTITTP